MHVRWLLIVLVGGYFAYLLSTRSAFTSALFNWYYIGAVTMSLAAANFVFAFILSRARKRGRLHPVLKYITMSVDFAAIAMVLIPTGGSASIFFVVYFIVIVSNSMRYGMKVALAGIFLFNISYLCVLLNQYYPSFEVPELQTETLKVAGFWLVGIYTGYLARRFQILQGEVEKYEKLVEKLTSQKNA